jgi:hypothetical protein
MEKARKVRSFDPCFVVAVSAGHESTVERSHFNATLAKTVLLATLSRVIALSQAFSE